MSILSNGSIFAPGFYKSVAHNSVDARWILRLNTNLISFKFLISFNIFNLVFRKKMHITVPYLIMFQPLQVQINMGNAMVLDFIWFLAIPHQTWYIFAFASVYVIQKFLPPLIKFENIIVRLSFQQPIYLWKILIYQVLIRLSLFKYVAKRFMRWQDNPPT